MSDSLAFDLYKAIMDQENKKVMTELNILRPIDDLFFILEEYFISRENQEGISQPSDLVNFYGPVGKYNSENIPLSLEEQMYSDEGNFINFDKLVNKFHSSL